MLIGDDANGEDGQKIVMGKRELHDCNY